MSGVHNKGRSEALAEDCEPHRPDEETRTDTGEHSALGNDSDVIDLVGRILATASRQCSQEGIPLPLRAERRRRTDLAIRWDGPER